MQYIFPFLYIHVISEYYLYYLEKKQNGRKLFLSTSQNARTIYPNTQ